MNINSDHLQNSGDTLLISHLPLGVKLSIESWGSVIFKNSKKGKEYTHEYCSQTT